MNTDTKEIDPATGLYAFKLSRNVEPAALAAGLVTLAQIMVEIRDGTNVLPPKGMDVQAIVNSVLICAGAHTSH